MVKLIPGKCKNSQLSHRYRTYHQSLPGWSVACLPLEEALISGQGHSLHVHTWRKTGWEKQGKQNQGQGASLLLKDCLSNVFQKRNLSTIYSKLVSEYREAKFLIKLSHKLLRTKLDTQFEKKINKYDKHNHSYSIRSFKRISIICPCYFSSIWWIEYVMSCDQHLHGNFVCFASFSHIYEISFLSGFRAFAGYIWHDWKTICGLLCRKTKITFISSLFSVVHIFLKIPISLGCCYFPYLNILLSFIKYFS